MQALGILLLFPLITLGWLIKPDHEREAERREKYYKETWGQLFSGLPEARDDRFEDPADDGDADDEAPSDEDIAAAIVIEDDLVLAIDALDRERRSDPGRRTGA